MPEVQHHMTHLRHLTFKRLTEQAGKQLAGSSAGAMDGSSKRSAPNGMSASADGLPVSSGGGAAGGIELSHLPAGATAGPHAHSPDVARNPFDQSPFSSLPL